MSEIALQWFEIIFNVTYLCVIWYLVYRMYTGKNRVASIDQPVARHFLWAFFLLALGDTGHVGFRVLAYAMGGLAQNTLLVGLGSLATAVTVTLFYVFVLESWRVRFNHPRNAVWVILLLAAIVRLIVIAFPQNEWLGGKSSFAWSMYRNIPLMIQGLGIAAFILVDSLKKHDRTFKWVAYMILLSYACYMPVIFLSRQVPVIGMLMIPKTMAYMAVAFIAYYAFYQSKSKGVVHIAKNH